MTYKTIVQQNAAQFLVDIQDAVQEGFYANDTVAGYPFLGILNEIVVTAGDKPEIRNKFPESIHTVHIQGYDNTTFVLDVQDAILQGFRIDAQTVNLNGLGDGHNVILRRAKEAEKAPAPQAPVMAPKALVAEPGIVASPEAQNVPEDATGGEKPRNKGGRPRKVVKDQNTDSNKEE